VANVVCTSNNNLPDFSQCVFQGGLYCLTLNYNANFSECVFKNSTSHLVNCPMLTGVSKFWRSTFYNSGTASDGINISTANNQYLNISFCVFDTIKRYAINNAGTGFVGLRLAGNDYSSITSGQLNGVYESYQHAAITESSSPFTSASGNDFTLVSTSTAVTQTFVFEMP